jgi:mannosyltransferase
VSSVTLRPAAADRPEGDAPAPQATERRRRPSARLVGALALLTLVVVSLVLRTTALDAAFWIDEAIAVGVSSYSFWDIPSVLRVDGSPPLYYLLLHLWMQAFGNGETATHLLSLLFSILCIPAALWAGRSLFGARAGWIAALLAALNPYLTYYAQETRMYSLQALLGLLVAACFVHAFTRFERRYAWLFGLALAAMLYTHNWALFVAMGSVAAVGALWRWAGAEERRAIVQQALRAYGLAAVLYVPWLPTLLHQVRYTGAPWAERPSAIDLLDAIGLLLGGTTPAIALLLIAGNGLAGLLRDRRPDRRIVALVALAVASILIAWLASLVSPAFANRYFAAFVGPLLIIAAIGLRHAGRMGLICLFVVCVFWLDPRTTELESKSNVRSLAASMATLVTTGDLIVSTHPEQLPVIAYYMPKGVRYADLLGPVEDPRILDWTNVTERLRETRPTPTIDRLLRTLRPGQELVLVQPILRTGRWVGPWTKLVRKRAVQWERRLDHDERVRREAVVPVFGYDRLPRGARAIVYRVR